MFEEKTQMSRLLSYLFFILLFPLVATAQKMVLNGIIYDQQGKILDMATLSLSKDGNLLNTIRSEKGLFRFEDLNAGNYLLLVSSIGYENQRLQLSLPADPLKIIMKTSSTALKEVVIDKQRPVIERKADRVIFNLENSISANGISAWDALNKTPGVQTTFDGNIKAYNKGVLVYLDDRPIRLSGEDLGNYLKSLPSEQISSIEVIPNPPSRYDAQGAAVINIVSRKIKAQGINVNLNSAYTQSRYGSYTSGTNFNYRKDKLNIYGGYSFGDSKKQQTEAEYIIFSTPSNYAYWDNNKQGARARVSSNYKAGIDYNLSSNQVVGLLFGGFNGKGNRTNQIGTQIYNDHHILPDSTLTTNNQTHNTTSQYSFNLNYKAKLDTLGQSLNIDLDYIPYRSSSNQAVNSSTRFSDGSASVTPYQISTYSKQRINIWSGKTDYSYVFNQKWSLEAGLKYSSITTHNRFDFFNAVGPAPIQDNSKSDEFEYSENTAAAYMSFKGKTGKWNIEGGLRAEQTRTVGNSIALNMVNKNNYFKIFPTLFLTYALDKDHEFNSNYSYRIDRPGYSRLNPFKYYTSPYTYLEGNPALQPAFIHNIELGYTYKQLYNFSLFYRESNGYFSNITVQDNINKIFYDTQRNLDKSLESGFYLSLPYHPADWWEMNNFVQGSYKQEKSGYLQSSYDYHTLGLYLNSSQAFVLDKEKGIKAEVSAWYSTPGIQGIYKLARTFDLSAGLRKTVLNKQGTIRLAVNDIFYGNAFRINVDYLNQRNGFYEKNDTRSVSLSFSYKLGKNKITETRKRNTSADEEKKRTGG
eukprot:gene4841-5628_t